MTDIVETLKREGHGDYGHPFMLKAAAEIETLRSEVERLKSVNLDAINACDIYKQDRETREKFYRARIAELEKERDDALNDSAAVALGIQHSTACTETTLCMRCERDKLHTAITEVVTQKLDDLCWLDVYQKLAALVGIEFDPLLLSRAQMLAQCDRFICSLHDGKPYSADVVTQRVRELEAKLEAAEQMYCVLEATIGAEEDDAARWQWVKDHVAYLHRKSGEQILCTDEAVDTARAQEQTP